MQAFGQKNGAYGLIWAVLAYFIIIKCRFLYFIVSLKTQIATQSEIEWKLNFNNLIMED